MRNKFLFSLHKISYMRYIVVLFCFFSAFSFAQNSKNHSKSRKLPFKQVESVSLQSDEDQILYLALSDFAQELSKSGNIPSKVVILENKTQLIGKKFSIDGINFVSGGKPEVVNNGGVSIAIWRFDLTESKAHLEFYYTDSRNQTLHKEYLLTKENAVWRK
jgi:hypothetical protein